MKKYAISDIHGCAKTFKALLEKINLSKEDELYLLGDYFDRGPDTKGVIDHIWQLQKEGYFVKCLLGNHELMNIEAYRNADYYFRGDKAVLKSFGINNIQDLPKPYVDWIKTLHLFIEVDEYILVHAGLNMRKEFPFNDFDAMVWIRSWYQDINREWLGDRIIVHGHTPLDILQIKGSLKTLDELPIIDIDCGCVYRSFGLGYLCAFELTERQFTFMRNQDEVVS